MLLRKTLSLSDVRLETKGDGATFAGYASVFGGVDSYGDTILKGAFESTLRTNGKPKMFFDHSWGMPIGKYLVAKEDDHGLYVEGELTPGLTLASDVKAAMKHGTLDGLSIGGYVKLGDYDTTETGRVIRKWSRLVEVSPVVFPADEAARIDTSTVKGAELIDAIEAIETIRDLETFLRDASGPTRLSKGAAAALVARVKTVITGGGTPPEDAETKGMRELTERLNQLSNRLAA